MKTRDMGRTRDDFIHSWLHEFPNDLELQRRFILTVLNDHPFPLENVGRLVTPAKKLEDTIRLAELVIEVLQQNEEHHAEVRVPTHCTVTLQCRAASAMPASMFG